MGMLSRIWKKIKGQDAVDQFFTRLPDSFPEDGQDLVPDDCYVELYVESLRLEKARRFAASFHGVVYSFVSLVREADRNAEIAAISKPEKLANLDKDSLGNVISVHKQMMGAAAWRGGNLGLEIGLFSVKSGNLLTPVLDFVTRVSTTAGVSFVGAVKPFLPLITEGIDLIAGQKDETNLEVGLDTDLGLTKTGTYAVIDAPKNSIDVAKLSLDPRDGKLLLAGQPLQKAYCVFSIRRQDQKVDYGQIPVLKEKTEALFAAIRKGVKKDAEDALTALKLEVIVSQDLITRDGNLLIQKAKDRVKAAFGGGGVSAAKVKQIAPEEEALEALQLYG
ncbi:MAG TPA: hypothetical protein VF548_12695 [Allosphingosinicella sp.]|jgi:hypothetical protein